MDTDSSIPTTIPRRAGWPKWLLLAGRLILGGVFVYAGYVKLRQPWMLFAMGINSYQMVSESTAKLLAQTLPWFELLLGIVLLTGWALRWSATVASALLVFFFSVMLRAYMKNLAIFCGCFGVGEKLGPLTLARDGSLALLALAVMIGAFLMRRQRT
jgi:uncharacterized membrane protein YphA (DoxX/SURF4 family)